MNKSITNHSERKPESFKTMLKFRRAPDSLLGKSQYEYRADRERKNCPKPDQNVKQEIRLTS